MKRFIFVLLSILPAFILSAKDIVIDGVRYTLNGVNTTAFVSIKAADKKNLPANLIIPPNVLIDNREYPVTKVDNNGFAGCRNLVTVELPYTITNLGFFAFKDCTSLKSVIMPDDAKAEISEGNFGFAKGGIFKGCTSLQDVRGISVPYPKYVVYETIWNCEEVPFYKAVQRMGAVTMSKVKGAESFADYVQTRVKDPVEKWQKRKEYETIAQWEARVTDANRARMISEYVAEARNSYLKEYSPATVNGILEDYNAQYGFFPVTTSSFGQLYVSVDPADAPFFKENWKNVEIKPVFGILDGQLSILDCKYILKDKTFNSPQQYDEDDLMVFVSNITPLSALREYEEMMASAKSGSERSGSKNFTPDAIDIEIPSTSENNDRTFAVIIGNEDYQRVAHVDYAMNDARIFAKYCNRTLGIPESNIRTYYNSTYGDIVAAMEDIANISKAYNGDINIIFYYAGHGVPDESNRNAYLLPIDATGTQTEVCYPLDKLYSQLGDLKSRSVVAFIDACFSGSLRGDGMLASARGIKLRPRDVSATGNMVVLSAASADQSAFPYHDKNHGLFTYYLLKKLKDSDGDVSVGDLSDYIITEVSKQSIVENKKPQVPNVKWSTALTDTWRDISLK